MDDADIALRNTTYAMFVGLGRAPSAVEVAAGSGLPTQDVQAAWGRLHDAHALVLNTSRDHLRMANPFSAVPTAYRVFAQDRWWYGNCAWDAVGICAALHSDGRIETSCPDCGDALTVKIAATQATPADLLFHCPVPARQWWDDIVFT